MGEKEYNGFYFLKDGERVPVPEEIPEFSCIFEGEDLVNSPSHYNNGGIECIDAIVASQGIEAAKHFCLCNAFKYLWRHNGKGGIIDIQKAKWYIDKFLEIAEER